MFPNPFNNMNGNNVPFQYTFNTASYSYYNPYQNQTILRNVVEPQYYNPAQQMQPMYFPYNQQEIYPQMLFPQNPYIIPNNNNPRNFNNQKQQKKNQDFKNQKARVKSEVDPSKPENSKEEIIRWIEARKKNYPTKANLAKKELEKKLKEEIGEIIEPPLSILEQKLRKKIKVLNLIDGRINRKREFEKNYLLKYITNPYKKLKTANLGNIEEKSDRGEANEKEEKDNPIETVTGGSEKMNKVSENKDVYDAYREFQMQINQIEGEKEEDGEILDKESPVERKIISEKTLDRRISELENKQEKKKENYSKDRKPNKLDFKKPNKIVKPVIKKNENENQKKSETIEEIIENLKQRKEKDNQEFTKILEGSARSSDYKYKSNTLLANLLIDTIYDEKNVILQCLRYIVKENFFDKTEL